MAAFIDLTGMRFGRLVVQERAESGVCCGKKTSRWVCICDCGEKIVTEAHSLRRGRTKSCGCLNREVQKKDAKTRALKHGDSDSRIYHIWAHMKQRCDNKNVERYKHYGGRGIFVCEEWHSSFDSFRAWALSSGYREDLTIDRIDVDGNYEPSNCRWATWAEQSRNRRCCKRDRNSQSAVFV